MLSLIRDYRERRRIREMRNVLDLRDELVRVGADEATVAALTRAAEDMAQALVRARQGRRR